MTTEQPAGRSFTTDTVFIAAVSAFAYLIAFLYEKGYCDHFGIPHTLIAPSVTNIFAAAVAMVSALMLLLVIGSPLIPILRATSQYDRMKPYGEIVFANAGITFMFLAGIVSFGFKLSVVIPLAFAMVALNATSILPVLRRYKHLPKWNERFKAAHAEEMRAFESFSRISDKLIGARAILVVVIAYLLSVLAYFAGSLNASNQREFLVLSNYPGHALLRTYGDMLIASKVDEQARQTGRDFLILRMSETEALSLSAQKLGPLKRPPNF